jgi:hypothetical protein
LDVDPHLYKREGKALDGSLFVNFSLQINRLYKIPTAQAVAARTRPFEPYPKWLFKLNRAPSATLGEGPDRQILLAFFRNRDRPTGT